MREFKVKIPFIGYSEVLVEIPNDHEFDNDKELEEAAWEDAENQVYSESSRMKNCDRFEILKHVEGSNDHRYRCVDVKFKYEIEDITEEDEEEEEDDTE